MNINQNFLVQSGQGRRLHPPWARNENVVSTTEIGEARCVKIRVSVQIWLKYICHYHRSVSFTRGHSRWWWGRRCSVPMLSIVSELLTPDNDTALQHAGRGERSEENWRQMVSEIASLLRHYTAPVNSGRRLLEKVPFYNCNCELMPVNVVSLHSRNSVFVLGLFWDVQDIIRYHLPRARYLNISLCSSPCLDILRYLCPIIPRQYHNDCDLYK